MSLQQMTGGASALPLNLLTQAIPMLTRHELESLTERLIEVLDEADGDLDIEPNGDELDCAGSVEEDTPQSRCGPGDGFPGDPDDAEEDDDSGQATEDEISCGAGVLYMHGAAYGGPGCPISDPDAGQLPS